MREPERIGGPLVSNTNRASILLMLLRLLLDLLAGPFDILASTLYGVATGKRNHRSERNRGEHQYEFPGHHISPFLVDLRLILSRLAIAKFSATVQQLTQLSPISVVLPTRIPPANRLSRCFAFPVALVEQSMCHGMLFFSSARTTFT